MTKRSTVLAAAAAALFVSGVATHAVAADQNEGGDKVKCDGVNGCKGQSECKTAQSSCNGKNECAGKGWVEMTADECAKAKAAQAK